MQMVLAVLSVLAICLALIILRVVPILPGIALMVIGLVVVAALGDRRDRARHRGIPDHRRRLDVDRGIIPTDMDHRPGDQLGTYVDTQVSYGLSDEPGPQDRSPD